MGLAVLNFKRKLARSKPLSLFWDWEQKLLLVLTYLALSTQLSICHFWEKRWSFSLKFFHLKLILREKSCLFVILSEKYLRFLSKMRIWELSPESVKKKQKCLPIVCSILLLVQNGLFTLFLGCWEEQRGLVHSGRNCFNLFQISILLNTIDSDQA